MRRGRRKMTKTVLVVAAHPDDEVLGCGGTIARHACLGDSVGVLLLSEGATARDPTDARGDIAALREAASDASRELGAAEPRFCSFPDNRLDTVPLLDVIKSVENVVEAVAPEIVYTHNASDLNIDHRIAHQAVVTACRPVPGTSVEAIYAFESVSSTEWQTSVDVFRPQRWVNIASFLDCKLRALGAYGKEMRRFPHARSLEGVEALARIRGASAGLYAAECFMVVRERVG